MKHLIFVITGMIAAFMLTACGGGETASQPQATPVPTLDPVSILTANDVYASINYEYVPVVDGGVIVHEDNTSKAVYVSDPKGEGDSVEIKVTQMTDTVSAEDVRTEFNEAMQKRRDTITISNLGESAYIAFPSIYVYDRGCILKITAGSASSTEQQNLLIDLASKAVANFEQIVPAPDVVQE